MSVAGGGKVLKYLVFIFNFLSFIIGCGVLGLGIYSKVGESSYIDLTDELSSDISKYSTAGNMMIAVGVIIAVVSFFGCCGAFTENGCMVLIFFVLLLLIFILEVAACIYGFVNRNDVKAQLKNDFTNAIQTRYSSKGTNPDVNKVIDNFQEKFKCCGYDKFTDWQQSNYYNDTRVIPKSCCRPIQEHKAGTTCPSKKALDFVNYYHNEGCIVKVTNWFKTNMNLIGYVAVAFAIIQILGLVFSMMLYCSIKSNKDGLD